MEGVAVTLAWKGMVVPERIVMAAGAGAIGDRDIAAFVNMNPVRLCAAETSDNAGDSCVTRVVAPVWAEGHPPPNIGCFAFESLGNCGNEVARQPGTSAAVLLCWFVGGEGDNKGGDDGSSESHCRRGIEWDDLNEL